MVFCYYISSSYWRPGNGKFNISNIDPDLCTHLAYAFFGMTKDGIFTSLDPHLDLSQDNGIGNIKQFNSLKQLNSDLKTLAVVGGYGGNSLEYFKIGADSVKRNNFINSAVYFLKINGFDGIDLDWEWSRLKDINVIAWLREIREEFNKHGFILTITVCATVDFPLDNILEWSEHVDLINLKTFSWGGAWNSGTSMVDPLYETNDSNVNNTIAHWLHQRVLANKLVLGLSFYGRTFTLKDPSNYGIGAPTLGPGKPGPFTNEAGVLGFNEICLDTNWTIDWDKKRRVPYGHTKSGLWVSFDNEWSIADKVNYALDKNLKGIMVMSLDSDDFRGDCGKAYPLLKEINNVIDKNLYINVE